MIHQYTCRKDRIKSVFPAFLFYQEDIHTHKQGKRAGKYFLKLCCIIEKLNRHLR